MQAIAVLLIFIGMFIVTHGIYEDKLRSIQQSVRVEHRFIPRTYLEEQHSNANLGGMYKNMFEGDASLPWLNGKRNDAGMMSKAIL